MRATRARRSSARSRWSLYFSWLLRPDRVGNPVLFAVLVVAELFNVVQALGFWWTCLAGGAGARRHRRPPRSARSSTSTCSSRPTASPSRSSRRRSRRRRGMRGARVHVALLDDGDREEMAAAGPPPRRPLHAARRCTSAPRPATSTTPSGAPTPPFVLVLDCDHVPYPDMLARTLPEFADAAVAFVQTPQYYANARRQPDRRARRGASRRCSSGRSPAARTPTASMFCCGTNVMFRRARARGGRRVPEGLADRGLRPLASSCTSAAGGRCTCRRCSPAGSARRTSPPTSASSTAGRGAASARSRRVLRAELPLPAKGCSTCCRRRTSCPAGPCSSTSSLPVDPHPHRRPAARRRRRRQLPRRLRPVLRAVAGDGGQRRRGQLHVRRLLAGDVDVLDPHPRHATRVAAAQPGSFVVTPKDGDTRPPAAARRRRRSSSSRVLVAVARLRPRPRPATRRR